MYCPKCGKENPENQRFCRSCGFRLETISEVVTTQSATSAERAIEILRGRPNKGWQDPLTYAFVLIAAGLLIGAIGYKVLSQKTLGDIGTLVALVGVFVIFLKGIFLVIPMSSTTTTRSQPPPRELVESQAPAPLQSREPVALLSPEPPSITEHTTKHLEPGLENDDEPPRTTRPSL